jgi:hypothetical protein
MAEQRPAVKHFHEKHFHENRAGCEERWAAANGAGTAVGQKPVIPPYTGEGVLSMLSTPGLQFSKKKV